MSVDASIQPQTAESYYLQRGLEFDPFAPAAMPDFFFVGGQRRFLVERAMHALYFSGAMVLLIGERGTGKTRLLDEVGKELAGLVDVCRIEATVLMDGNALRAELAAAIGLPAGAADSNAAAVVALNQAGPGDRQPQPVLLAIDSAQSLSIPALAECAALIQSAGGRLRLLLAGTPELAEAWRQAEIGAAEWLSLPALDRQESADYIRTRLQAAGAQPEGWLSEAMLSSWYAVSGGNFASIHARAGEQLAVAQNSAVAAQRSKQWRRLLPVLAGAVALAGVILLLLYRGGGDKTAAPVAVSMSTPAGDGSRQSVALTLPAPQTAAPAVEPMPAMPAVEAAPVPVAPVAAPAAERPAPAAATPVPKPEPATVPTPPAAAPSPAVAASAKIDSKKKKVEPQSKAESQAKAKSGATADERALLALPGKQFLLQLMGAESKATVDKFAAGAARGVKLYTYRTELRGKPWFIVLTGPYADKSAAQAAIAKLPPAVQKQQPWPRSAANIQADIDAH